jgi:hypothetical protein
MTGSVTVTCPVTATGRAQHCLFHSCAEIILRVSRLSSFAFLRLINKLLRNLAFQQATSLSENI